MTREELTEHVKKEYAITHGHIWPDLNNDCECQTDALHMMNWIDQWTAGIIGDDEEETGLSREEDFAISWVNGEKAEQRKRAGLSTK